jgi:hypothetical protein
VASGYVSGETMLRPIRMGLAIAPGSTTGLRRAIELATSSWGGQGFPIVEVGADPRPAVQLAVAMGVDCFFPVEKDDELKGLAKTPGFEWVPSWQGLSPFNRDPEGRHEHVLPASVLYDWYRLSRQQSPYHVTWSPGHQLEDLLAVWFGRFGDDVTGRADRLAFEAVAQGCPLGPGLPLPPFQDPYTAVIDAILDEDLRDPRRPARTIRQILDHLITEHNATGISYPMVARYAGSKRSLRPRPRQPGAASPGTAEIRPAPQAAWSPAHQAIDQHDLVQLRQLLDAGNDAENETQDGLTLLRHAVHREHTAHIERDGPLHVGMTVLLLARGADPHHLRDGTSIETEAEILGHWLAAEVIRAWKPAPR